VSAGIVVKVMRKQEQSVLRLAKFVITARKKTILPRNALLERILAREKQNVAEGQERSYLSISVSWKIAKMRF